MGETTTADILHRLSRLERQNRRLKIGGLATLAAVAGLLVMGATESPRVVEAEKFILNDGNGKVAAVLSVLPTETGNGSRLELRGDGMAKAVMEVVGGQPAVILYDTDGKVVAALNAGGAGAALERPAAKAPPAAPPKPEEPESPIKDYGQ
jgi:hypothetical protein